MTLQEALDQFEQAWRAFVLTVARELGVVRVLNWLTRMLKKYAD